MIQELLYKSQSNDLSFQQLEPPRRLTNSVSVSWAGKSVNIGGQYPIVVQSMTNTNTKDVLETAIQVRELSLAGSDLVRITVDSHESARSVVLIREHLDKMNISTPLVGDFHFNGHKLLKNFPDCAQALSKYRINPGNVGLGKKREDNFASMIEIACLYKKPIRIGVNWGSLDNDLLSKKIHENKQRRNPQDVKSVTREALVFSAIDSAKRAERLGLSKNAIILSCKVSDVQELIKVYQALSRSCSYPLHVGLTEAGMSTKGIVASTAAIAVLLQQGIGDTIRISLTPEPGSNRCLEVSVALEILQTMGFRHFMPSVVSCPGCGRTNSKKFQELAHDIQDYLHKKISFWKPQYPGVETMSVAVMGCVVNGPGESKNANIGISLPGNGENPVAPVFIDGQHFVTLKGNNLAQEFQLIIENYVKNRYSQH